jgi:DNA-binding Lrp family transcriptional regulator
MSEQLWELAKGALATRALAIVADLDIAERLADGSRPVADLARESGADEETLHRLLRALASEGVFAETEPRVYENTAASQALRDPGRRAMAHLFGGVWHRAAGGLDATGESVFPREFGTDFWAWLAVHPDEREAFDAAMVDNSRSSLERLERAGFRGEETVVDIGGGNGSLLGELLAEHPELHGVVFDLPETVRDESHFGDRLEFVEGSFFDAVPAGDVYILSTIVHDWDDEPAAAILRTVRAAAPDHARLIVLDAVVQPGNEHGGHKWLDLLMLTLLSGRERDEAQWRALFAGTGWEPTRIEDGLLEAVCR